MQTFDDVFSAFGGPAEIGRVLGVTTEHASAMRRRGAIPPARWPRLISAAGERQISITYETLASLYAGRGEQARAS